MTLLALRAILARIPSIAWVILGTTIALAFVTWAIYRSGERHEASVIHRAALDDSVHVAHRAVDTATSITRGRVVMATRHRAKSDSALTTYQTQRAAIGTALDSAPPAVIALVYRADTTIAQLDTTVQVQASALAAFQAERAARIAADSLEAHQAEDPRPSTEGGHAFPVTVVLVAAGAALVILHFLH